MSPGVEAVVDPVGRMATVTTTFGQPADVVWTLFSDPAKLARWWGPPGAPMTVDHHDLRPGGRVEVTVEVGGSTIRGRWEVTAVEPPRALRFTFASDGIGATDIDVRIDPGRGAGTTMVVTARFATDADLAHAAAIGFAEGLARSCASAVALLDG